jgi:hypothetical protein
MYGSSTIGGKKSTVLMSAISSETLYTQASSLLSNPTRILGSLILGRPERISERTPGPILAPQPPALVISVRRILSPEDGAGPVLQDEPLLLGGSMWQASLAFASFSFSLSIVFSMRLYYHNRFGSNSRQFLFHLFEI